MRHSLPGAHRETRAVHEFTEALLDELGQLLVKQALDHPRD
jgi:hypothetical protein